GVTELVQKPVRGPRRDLEPHRQGLCGERKRPRMDRYIDNRGKSEMAAAREEDHRGASRPAIRPVDPNPSLVRAVAANSLVSTSTTFATGATTSWAIRAPLMIS